MIHQQKLESESRRLRDATHQMPYSQSLGQLTAGFCASGAQVAEFLPLVLGLMPRQTIQGLGPNRYCLQRRFTESGVLLPMGYGPMTEFPAQRQELRESPNCRLPYLHASFGCLSSCFLSQSTQRYSWGR